MVKEESKRVYRTKRDLRTGLIELLATKSIDKISVKDICDHTLISKMTFYKHYDGKEDLLRDCIDSIAEEFDNGIRTKISEEDFINDISGAFVKYIRAIVERCMSFKNIILSIVNTQDFIKIMRKVLISRLMTTLDEFRKIDKNFDIDVDTRSAASFLLGGFSYSILCVLKDEMTIDELCKTAGYITKNFEAVVADKKKAKSK